jgi:hypothetical protein
MIGSWRKERLEAYQLVSTGSAGPSRAYPVAKLHRCSGRMSVMLKDGVKKGRLAAATYVGRKSYRRYAILRT